MSHSFQDLLGEVVVNVRRFQSQIAWRVDAVPFFLWGFCGCFTDCQQVKIRIITLVKEEFIANALNNNIPGVHRAGTAHQSGQDSVRGKHISLRLGQL